MSLKYERVKKADLDLPAPLRWLTRAFSSITLAVILLSLVCLYGVVGSVPVFMLVLGLLYVGAFAVTVGPAALAGLFVMRGLDVLPTLVRVAISLALLAGAGYVAVELCYLAYEWAHANPVLAEYRATVLYRLPALEMTELEFYAWWPMQLLLILFVLNMVWATIRRIEFSFVNIGVLTVHSGIVVIAVGSILYGHFKVEGDTILWRRDLGGTFESVFYDATRPALFVEVGDRETMFALGELPRYNDYELGELDIRLHERAGFAEEFGDNVRMSIPGFIAYGDLTTSWRPIHNAFDRMSALEAAPGLPVAQGERDGPGMAQRMLVAGRPADRVLEGDRWAIEYLVEPDERRLRDLQAEFPGPHGLVVELPEHDFREVYAIEPGMRIEAGETGYTFTVNEIGPYDMPFMSEGYEGATDTRAVVHVHTPSGEHFTRIVLHRYPERSQDFVPHDDDDYDGGGHGAHGPALGDRREPDPSVHLAYLDNTRVQYHVVELGEDVEAGEVFEVETGEPFEGDPDLRSRTRSGGALGEGVEPDGGLDVIVRLPGMAGMYARVRDGRLRLPEDPAGMHWLHLGEPGTLAGRIAEPVAVPRARRDPSDEGTHINALLPVLIEVDNVEGHSGTWRRLVWMRHMRYPKYPDAVHRPVHVDVPGLGTMRLAFSRQRYDLPFAVALDDFEMQPYPGSDIPRDFVAYLSIADLDGDGLMHRQPEQYRVHMNNPITYRAGWAPVGMGRIKVSQVAWDPPAPDEAQADARDAEGRLINQQRFTILGIGNNVGIQMIFVGSCMVVLGIPWAFYIKPVLVRRQRDRLTRGLGAREEPWTGFSSGADGVVMDAASGVSGNGRADGDAPAERVEDEVTVSR